MKIPNRNTRSFITSTEDAPGAKIKAWKLAKFVDKAIRSGDIQPTIYVWPNGGPMSWYNYPQKEKALGEDVFIKETVPHIDKTYWTAGTRAGRGIQGFARVEEAQPESCSNTPNSGAQQLWRIRLQIGEADPGE